MGADVCVTTVHDREVPDALCGYCDIVIGVDPGSAGVVLCRCAVGIGEVRVVPDAPCHCHMRGACLCGLCLVSLCRGVWWWAWSVGRAWCLCAMDWRGVRGLCGVSCGCAMVIGGGAGPVGCVWRRCAVGIGEGVVVFSASGVAVLGGLLGGVSF